MNELKVGQAPPYWSPIMLKCQAQVGPLDEWQHAAPHLSHTSPASHPLSRDSVETRKRLVWKWEL